MVVGALAFAGFGRGAACAGGCCGGGPGVVEVAGGGVGEVGFVFAEGGGERHSRCGSYVERVVGGGGEGLKGPGGLNKELRAGEGYVA